MGRIRIRGQGQEPNGGFCRHEIHPGLQESGLYARQLQRIGTKGLDEMRFTRLKQAIPQCLGVAR